MARQNSSGLSLSSPNSAGSEPMGRSVAEIVAAGYQESVVRWVLRRVELNEWKRHQAAPGIKVTSKAFGMGRRMPIVQKFRE